jgi:DNA polymerase-3 subunit gamma/tau
VGLVRFEAPEIDIRPVQPLSADFNRDLAQALREITGVAWQVRTSDGPAAPTLMQQEQGRAATARAAILDTPVVKAALAAFPGAELVEGDQSEQWSVGT